MSLQFIFGNSGSGKSHYLYQQIVEESIRHPEKNYLVLVPEQFTMQTQKDLCMAHPRGGIMNIDVLSFGRLAHRVFEETGKERQPILDDEGKNLVLRKIAGNYEDELTVLKGNLKKQGYISEVKSVISEFTQYGIDFEQLDSFMEGLNSESYLYYKLKDIRKVYEGFEDYLHDKYITKEELLDVLSQNVAEAKMLKDSVIAMDGFTGFTPVQNRLIGELLKVCDKIMLTVEIDRREDPFVYKHPYQLFALSKQMVTSLTEVAQEVKVEIDEPVWLCKNPPYRFKENPEMAFLEEELFRYSRRKYSGEKMQSISLHEVHTPQEEAQYVAEEIRRLVREEGYRYREIAVIASDLNTYADSLEKACERYEIPVFMDHKKSILLNSFVEYLRSLLVMVEQNYTYESVFRYLRTGLCGFTRDEVDRLENYCLALDLKGFKKWDQVWVRKTPMTKKEELEELNQLHFSFNTYEDIISNSNHITEEQMKNALLLPMLAFVLTFLFSVSMILLMLDKKMETYSIYYLYGLSKKKSYFLILGSIGCLELLAFVINAAVNIFYCHFPERRPELIRDIQFSWDNLYLLLVQAVIILGIIFLEIFVTYHRKSFIEIKNQELK